MKLTKELKALMVRFLDNEVFTLSWGITDIQILDGSIKFKVNGLKYKGIVEIYPDEKGYIVNMNNNYFSSNLEDIISFLDNKIEHTKNYSSDILNSIS